MLNKMEEQKQRRLEERKIWLGFLTKYVRPGRIVEFGCGSGFVLEILSCNFTDSIIIGIDKSMERLEEAAKKALKNVILIKADITQNIFANNTFDTATFVGCLHEVFSYLGEEKLEDTLRIAYNSLNSDGVLIIQDFLKPIPRSVNMTIKNEETQKKFFRFVREFRQRKVHFERRENVVKIDIVDAVEFVSKYRSPNEEDWKEEMAETHFFFTEQDYKKIAEQADFLVKDLIKLPSSEEHWLKINADVDFDFKHEYQWIQLVLMKK